MLRWVPSSAARGFPRLWGKGSFGSVVRVPPAVVAVDVAVAVAVASAIAGAVVNLCKGSCVEAL